jgi:hypothetical protein
LIVRDEIEITPQMIEAGEEVILQVVGRALIDLAGYWQLRAESA